MTYRRKLLISSSLLMLVMNLIGQASQCLRSEYLVGNECCPMCLAGRRVKSDCTEFKHTSCLICTEGTFMDHPTGLKHCFPCTVCEPGSGLKVKTLCTLKADTVCEPLDGFYCVDVIQEGCAAAKKHSQCQPGQFIIQEGSADRDTKCSDCSAGTFSNGTLPYCQPHKQCESMNLQLINPGTASADAQCGEHSSHPPVVIPVVFVIIVVVIIIIIALAVLFIWSKRKRKGCSIRVPSRKIEDAENVENVHDNMLDRQV